MRFPQFVQYISPEYPSKVQVAAFAFLTSLFVVSVCLHSSSTFSVIASTLNPHALPASSDTNCILTVSPKMVIVCPANCVPVYFPTCLFSLSKIYR